MHKHSFQVTSLFAVLLLPFFIAQPAFASILVDGSGHVIINQGQVLGDSDNSGSGSSDDSKSDDNSGSGSSNSEDSKDTEDVKDTEDSKDSEDEVENENESESEVEQEDGTKVKTEIRGDESKTEIKYADGTVYKTETRDGKTKTVVYQNGVKVKIEREGDRFRIKTENASGQETEIGDDNLVSIEERADRNQVRIRTFDNTEDQLRNRAIIERLNTQALTDLPLSVNLQTNELTVTTPAGEKTVTVLPDQAVQNMLAANVIDRVGGQELSEAVQQGGVEALDNVIELEDQDGTPTYIIKGVKNRKLLGFFDVTTDVEVEVSAETGELVDTNQSLLDTIISAFSSSK